MIFLTVGTHEPFDRLVEAVDKWCGAIGAEVFGQITDRAEYQPSHFPFIGRIRPEVYHQKCREAKFLVAHAGMGSIITAMTMHKPIIILPRRGHLGETRNDHQYATAAKLGKKPGIFAAKTESELPDILDQVSMIADDVKTTRIKPYADSSLTDSLRRMIEE